uniref:Uncharacterized protein n=1 Tax=Trypanosoma congolense (strain IL3000) TaxID=1068625 RepID=G0V0P3_TRYCI|nr:hypothetical protein, unlikely [Trypanosoma congolense IL3000]
MVPFISDLQLASHFPLSGSFCPSMNTHAGFSLSKAESVLPPLGCVYHLLKRVCRDPGFSPLIAWSVRFRAAFPGVILPSLPVSPLHVPRFCLYFPWHPLPSGLKVSPGTWSNCRSALPARSLDPPVRRETSFF